MFTPIELFIGQRYTHSRRRNRFISFIAFASMLGILLGVAVLITILSVMNGFEKELRDKILGVVSHVTVSGTNGQLADWTAQIDGLKAMPEVVGAAPYVQKQVMLVNGNLMRGVLLQGIDPSRQSEVSDVNFKMLEGGFQNLAPREYGIVLGAEAAAALAVLPGDKVTVIVPQVQVTPAGILPRLKRFTVVGVYQVGHPEYDGMTAFIELGDAARLFRMGEEVSGIRLKLDDLFAAPAVAHQLQAKLGEGFNVVDWSEEHGNFFRAVKTERIVMTLILFLVVCVALFNLVASLVMTVNDKRADIAILRTYGMDARRIMRIFMVQGSIIGFVGTLLGVALGVWLALHIGAVVAAFEQTFGFKVFSSDIFYISDIPSDLRWENVLWITVASLMASVVATLYPAWRAAQIQPAEALRYE